MMNSRAKLAWLLLVGSAGIGVTLLGGCPGSLPDVGPFADGGGGDGSQVDGAPSCDPSKDPSCVNDSSGIFVSSGGADSNAGTKEAPLKTIGAAIAKTSSSKNAVYVCAGTYPEHVKISSAVNLYGGFACADWTYASTNKAKVAPSDVGYALDIESVSSAVAVQDLEFDAVDGKNAGDSSIAAFVSSSNVTFTRDTFSAGAGVAGTSGTLTTLTFPDQTALNGNNADGGLSGAPEVSFTCPSDAGVTIGGAGGLTGVNGEPGKPPQSGIDGGAGGTVLDCIMNNTGGKPGASAPAGGIGAGAITSGAISSTGWEAAIGGSGGTGGAGQGGGGGAGNGGFGGGGGGAGGCGGSGGTGGAGGGGSIALLSNASTVGLTACSLTTKEGGNGGAGSAGQAGQTPGGFGGNKSGASCNGGNGGSGGNGGAGGGGAGGVSVGILFKGSAPTIDSATQSAISPGTAGAKGAGGAPGVNDGIVGVSQATLEIK